MWATVISNNKQLLQLQGVYSAYIGVVKVSPRSHVSAKYRHPVCDCLKQYVYSSHYLLSLCLITISTFHSNIMYKVTT